MFHGHLFDVFNANTRALFFDKRWPHFEDLRSDFHSVILRYFEVFFLNLVQDRRIRVFSNSYIVDGDYISDPSDS